jgi:hypothetical protein
MPNEPWYLSGASFPFCGVLASSAARSANLSGGKPSSRWKASRSAAQNYQICIVAA